MAGAAMCMEDGPHRAAGCHGSEAVLLCLSRTCPPCVNQGSRQEQTWLCTSYMAVIDDGQSQGLHVWRSCLQLQMAPVHKLCWPSLLTCRQPTSERGDLQIDAGPGLSTACAIQHGLTPISAFCYSSLPASSSSHQVVVQAGRCLLPQPNREDGSAASAN